MAITYKDAGVDIDAGDRLVREIKSVVQETSRPEVLSGLGGFAGLFAVPPGFREPVLVSGTDGVGTKLKTALATGRHRDVGIDLVAMVVNDIIVTGAQPLFFLDYFATGRLDVATAREVIGGIAAGCKQAGCALVGGETAEMPGLYQASDYDLAGFGVGIVERAEIRDGKDLIVGDVLIGLPSSGLHSNGHSLARKVVFEILEHDLADTPNLLEGASIADELLRPTRIYAGALASLARAGLRFKAASHITGGGLIENPPRMFASSELTAAFEIGSWRVPPIFELIASAGVETNEMRRTFNMGLGMVLAVSAEDRDATVACLAEAGQPAVPVGFIEARQSDSVVFR